MANTYSRRPDAELSAWMQIFKGVVGGDTAGYNTTTEKVDEVVNTQSELSTAVLAYEAAKSALAAASDARAAARQSALIAVAAVARDIYGGPVSDAMISACGLVPHDATRSVIIPQQPIQLLVTPFADGSVTCKWHRNGNAKGMQFLVEATESGEDWRVITGTTKTRITLMGYRPGASALFRVRAVKDGAFSEPSNTSGIYLPTPDASAFRPAA